MVEADTQCSDRSTMTPVASHGRPVAQQLTAETRTPTITSKPNPHLHLRPPVCASLYLVHLSADIYLLRASTIYIHIRLSNEKIRQNRKNNCRDIPRQPTAHLTAAAGSVETPPNRLRVPSTCRQVSSSRFARMHTKKKRGHTCAKLVQITKKKTHSDSDN